MRSTFARARRSLRPGSTAALVCLILLTSQTAPAQDAASDSVLQEVVVTARFRTENLQETPLSITAVSGEMLENQGLTNVSDLGLAIPNANIRQQSNIFGPNPQIGLRGVNTNEFIYTTEPGVAVYVDDIYHGTLTGSSMDLLDLERVEVLRGPQGTLFGKNSLGGAIRLISKSPRGDNTGNIEATYGSSNRLDLKAGYDFSVIDEKLFMRLSGVSKQIDGYQDRIDFTCQMIANGTPQLAGTLPQEAPSNAAKNGDCKIGENGGSRTNAARAMLRYLATEDLEMNLAVDYSRTVAEPGADSLLKGYNPTDVLHGLYNTLVIQPRFGMRYNDDRFVTGDPYKTYANYNDPVGGARWPTDQTTDSWSAAGKVDYNITERVHLKGVVAYRTYDSDWTSDGDLTAFDLSTTLNLQHHSQKSAELVLSGALFANRLEWTTGAFYYDSTSRLGGYVTFGQLSFLGIIPNFDQNDGFTTESKSAFAHVVYNLTDALSFTAGVRETDETKQYTFDHTGFLTIADPLEYGGNHFDWKVGLDYKFADATMLYGVVSTGFRSDGAQPRPFVPAQLRSVPGEEITAYEIGLKSDFFGHRLRMNFAAFLNDYDPRITTRIGYQCNPANATDPGAFFPISSNPCPAGTPLAGQTGFLWINYFSAPGKARGAELELTAAPIESLALNASAGFYTYDGGAARGEDGFIDASVRDQPRLNVSFGAQYAFTFTQGSLTPRLDWFYQSERTSGDVRFPQRDPYNIVPSYSVANARLTFDSTDKRWSASLSAENLFDKFYWITLGSERSNDPNNDVPIYNRSGVPSRGREWALTFRRTF
jgi:iron complex outermembrane receptor protein